MKLILGIILCKPSFDDLLAWNASGIQKSVMLRQKPYFGRLKMVLRCGLKCNKARSEVISISAMFCQHRRDVVLGGHQAANVVYVALEK